MSTFERVCILGTFARVSFVEQPPFAKHASMLLQKATAFRATLIKALSDAEVSFYVDTVCSHSATWNLNITEFTKGKRRASTRKRLRQIIMADSQTCFYLKVDNRVSLKVTQP
ncbi:hypothetical protein V1478_016649 [Vespula squamosa]|uniref:Uncharacterized protein n=1 Tax=Vespula squamosa TaxID=30214 RepID=A0ABD2A0D6_VESSQ